MNEQQIFKLHIAQDLNDLLMQIDWTDRVCRGVTINANNITDNMVAQIQHAMIQDKKIPYHIRCRFGIRRQKVTLDLYHELLYNDILINKETI